MDNVSNKTIIGILITVLTVALSGCITHCSHSFRFKAQKQVATSTNVKPDSHIFTNLTHTDIAVTGQDTDKCTVTADLFVSATSREIADSVIEKIDVKLVQKADRLEIIVEKPELYENEYSVSAKMSITVPKESQLEMITTHGDCRFENIQQAATVRSTHGDLKLDNIRGDITAASTHGNVNITNTENTSVKVNTSHGKISLSDCKTQQILCSTTHDPIHLNKVSADSLDLRTTHDPIQLTECTAKQIALNASHGSITGDVQGAERLTARTTHAPIHLTCVNETTPDITANLSTTHNKIVFCPPAQFSGSVSFSTTHGNIQVDRAIMVQGTINDDHLSGTIGQGSGSITLNSTHGNIILKSHNSASK